MDYNYEIHAKDGSLIERSFFTSLSKAKAIDKARATLAKGIGAYALITSFDWQRGQRVVGKLNANN